MKIPKVKFAPGVFKGQNQVYFTPGYLAHDVEDKIGKHYDPEQSVALKCHMHTSLLRRKQIPVKISNEVVYEGACLPCPDTRDPYNSWFGSNLRFGKLCPRVHPHVMRRLREFVRLLVHRNFRPIPCTYQFSFWDWVRKTSYNTSEIVDFLRVSDQYLGEKSWRTYDATKLEEFYPIVTFEWIFKDKNLLRHYKMHMKAEDYEKYKVPRLINASHLAYRAWFGMRVKAMEDQFYEHIIDNKVSCVKHVPVRDRAQYVDQFLKGHYDHVVGTDHTAFEAHFTPQILKSVECQLYSHLLRNFRGDFGKIRDLLVGQHFCESRLSSITVPGVRMTGECCTSLGNTFTNLVVMMFVFHEKHIQHYKGLVEGDDGLFVFDGPMITLDEFIDVGFELKLEEFKDVFEASFCGIRCSGQTKHNLIDPVEKILKVGWSFSKLASISDSYRQSLLKAKAYSLFWEAPFSPVTSVLARKIIQLTTNVNELRLDDWWDNYILMNLPDYQSVSCDIPMCDRVCYEQYYGVSVAMQLSFEHWVNSWTVLHNLNHATTDSILSTSKSVNLSHCRHFWDVYVYIFRSSVKDRQSFADQS